MPQKANPPRGQVAREPEISLLELSYHHPRSGDGKSATFLEIDLQAPSRDWLSDLEYFNSDGGSHATDG